MASARTPTIAGEECQHGGEPTLGQMARRGRHTSGGSSACAYHAIRIPVAVVRRRSGAVKGVDGSTATAAGIAAEVGGARPQSDVDC